MAEDQKAQSNGTPGSGSGNGGNQQPGCGSDADISRLLVSSFESSVRTAYCMMRIPVVCYANLLDTWCRAIEEATRQCEGGSGGGAGGGGGIKPRPYPGDAPGPIARPEPSQQ